MNSAGPRIERSTCVSAAKLTIASQPAAACATARVGDVALVELVVDAGEVRAVAGVGQLVEDDDLVPRLREAADEVRADEAGAAGDEDAHRANARSIAVTRLARTGATELAPRDAGSAASSRIVDQRNRARHSRRPSRQCGSSGAPFSRAQDRVRRAAAPSRRTRPSRSGGRAQARPASSKIASANSAQRAVARRRRRGRRRTAARPRRAIAAARWPV